MLDSKKQKSVGLRLRRIEGQIRGFERMVVEGRLCVDLLIQIAAAQAALKGVGDEILHYLFDGAYPNPSQSAYRPWSSNA